MKTKKFQSKVLKNIFKFSSNHSAFTKSDFERFSVAITRFQKQDMSLPEIIQDISA